MDITQVLLPELENSAQKTNERTARLFEQTVLGSESVIKLISRSGQVWYRSLFISFTVLASNWYVLSTI